MGKTFRRDYDEDEEHEQNAARGYDARRTQFELGRQKAERRRRKREVDED